MRSLKEELEFLLILLQDCDSDPREILERLIVLLIENEK